MKLEAYSLTNILFNGDAVSLNCKTAVGEITVLDNHKPLIAMLAPGIVTVTLPDGKENFFEVTGGFLEVQAENRVRIIADTK